MGKIYFTCSFDDGDVADLRLAELLAKYNLKGTFYIPRSCDLVNKSLSENQIRDLGKMVEIGGHTMSHEVLTHISAEKARFEIHTCKSWLENITSKPVQAFCPPTGRFNSDHVALQREAGFTSMRTVQMLSYAVKKIEIYNDFVVLPTTSQVYNHSYNAYLKNCMKRLQLSCTPVFMKLYHRNWEVMSRRYITYLQEISGSEDVAYYFHLWGHSWEIEKYALWNSLENFFKNLSAMDGVIVCNNSELSEIARQRESDA